MKTKIKDIVKRIGRSNKYVEVLSYLLQNNFLHKIANFSGDGDYEYSPEGVYGRCRQIAEEYIRSYPGDLRGKSILEIGPGKSLVGGYCLAELTGAKSVVLYDEYHQLDLEMDSEIVREHFPKPPEVDYRTGFYELGRLNQKFDYIVSNAVLEHVWNINELMSHLERLSHPGTVMYHVIDFGNHNKFASRGELYFLRFSDRLWSLMASKIGHPNRILKSEMESIFKRHGFTFDPLIIDFHPDEVVDHSLRTYLSDKKFPALDLKIKGIKVLCRCKDK